MDELDLKKECNTLSFFYFSSECIILSMQKLLNQLIAFVKETSNDPRIPTRDKKILIILMIVFLIRLLFIPDWIPYFGILDILFLLGVILDYFFGVIDQNLLLSHYPWGMKSFARIKRISLFLAYFAPNFIKDNLWDYKKDPF
jgi:hypothetical protein